MISDKVFPVQTVIAEKSAQLEKPVPGHLIGLLIKVHEQYGLSLGWFKGKKEKMYQAFYKQAKAILDSYGPDIAAKAVARAGYIASRASAIHELPDMGFSFVMVRRMAEEIKTTGVGYNDKIEEAMLVFMESTSGQKRN